MIRRIHSTPILTGAALAIVVALAAGAAAQGSGQGTGQSSDQTVGQGDGQGRRGKFGPRGFGRGGFGLGQLDLTDTQRQQVREVMQRHRTEMQEAAKRLRDAHAAQRAAVETVPVNEGLIRSTTQTLAAAQTEMALVQARVHNEVWSLLTPEQQQKAKEQKERREARAKERLQRRQQR